LEGCSSSEGMGKQRRPRRAFTPEFKAEIVGCAGAATAWWGQSYRRASGVLRNTSPMVRTVTLPPTANSYYQQMAPYLG
jgi:hypothetical protein